jgi:hypothetical protein
MNQASNLFVSHDAYTHPEAIGGDGGGEEIGILCVGYEIDGTGDWHVRVSSDQRQSPVLVHQALVPIETSLLEVQAEWELLDV